MKNLSKHHGYYQVNLSFNDSCCFTDLMFPH